MVHDAIQKLHQLAHSAIFGQTAWPAKREKCESIWQMLADAELIKETANGTFSYTDPSVTAELDLLLAFIGATEPWDIPFDLTKHGYASEEEAMQVWEAETEAEGMRLLKLLIFRAYQMHAGKPELYGNFVDLRPVLRRSVRSDQESKRARKLKKPGAQIEMLLPIDGKK